MDAGVAAIIAASISTILGGITGFLSSYMMNRANSRTLLAQQTLPRILDSLEFVAVTQFELMSGKTFEQVNRNKYISSCYWLPNSLRVSALTILAGDVPTSTLLKAHEEVLSYLRTMERSRS